MSASRGLSSGHSGRSILIGLGFTVVAPLVWPAVAAVTRSVAKVAIKGYLALAESLRETDLDPQEPSDGRAAGSGDASTVS